MRSILKKLIFLIAIILFFMTKDGIAYAGTDDFIITDDGTLSKYSGNDTIVTVPDTVKAIGDRAFENCTRIEEIIIPEGVTEIKESAFCRCTNLKHITFPSTLTTIQDNVFYDCMNLKEVTIPKLVTNWNITYDDLYYDDYTDGIEKYNIDPENAKFSSIDGVVYNKDITVLLYYPFNRKEETYTLPDSVTDISKMNFSYAKYLKHIIFNNKVTMKYDEYGLFTCHFLNGTLESFTVPDGNESFCDIDGVLFSKDKETLISYPEKKKGEIYKIPEGTKRLYIWSLSTVDPDHMELKYVLFPSSIKEINGNVGYELSYDDSGPNINLVFFGEKGSITETYAKTFDMKFNAYDTTKKGAQLLLSASDLTLTPAAAAQIKPLLISSDTAQAISWKSSNPSIVSIDQQGNISAKKIGTAVVIATTKSGLKATCNITVKLPAPSDIKVIKGSSSGIVLSWKKVSGAKSYTIYRSTVNYDSPYEKIGTTTKLVYTDKKVKEAMDYDYKVISNFSDPSYCSEFSDRCYIRIPHNVTELTITQSGNGVDINWFTYDSSVGVIIYRRIGKNGKYKKLYVQQSFDSSSFTDTSVKTGVTYYYKVQVYYDNNDVKVYSGYTDPISIKVK